MQVRVLGRVEVRGDDGAAIALGQRKLGQLVVVLALADGPISSERLRAMLWEDTRNAVSALTTTLNRLRQVLPDRRLVREEGGYRLVVDPERDYLDVREFRELVATARTVREAYPERSAELLQRAVELWREPQLPDGREEAIRSCSQAPVRALPSPLPRAGRVRSPGTAHVRHQG